MSDLTVYHGHASPTDLTTCRENAPSISHGIEWSDAARMVKRDEPYIVDNGAYSGFEPDAFRTMLETVEDMPRPPEWVVLPDKLDDWNKTIKRARNWCEEVRDYGYDYYVVGQPPADPGRIVEHADSLCASGVFLGGSNRLWKFQTAAEIDSLPVHIGNPGLGSYLTHAARVADSVDTTSIVVNDSYHHLTRLETETTLTEVPHV